ncbi:MAG: NGG1p interacting factor NIF3 [Spirochaetales bacterium]|jgi:hypothetical protein|nr:NGG1p interacting factor NIF3 [Exilispira sp.]NMC67884.1 NGG1p interacting factor NIF3 [Spirochaetales bacterium]
MYLLITFIPEKDKDKVIDALFNAGAGKFSKYDRAAFICEGIGRFRPLENANPYIGEKGKDEFVKEVRFETIVDENCIDNVLKTLKDVHPYEQPAVYIIKLDEKSFFNN